MCWTSRTSKRWSAMWVQPRSHPAVRLEASPHERPKPRADMLTTAYPRWAKKTLLWW
jgi:hypothetical protein